jgi:hypothetical protein
MEVVKNSIGRQKEASRTANYKMWKQSLHKWDQYVINRHKQHKLIDDWSFKILSEVDNTTVVYNSGGLFLKEFNSDIIVVENLKCPIDIAGMNYMTDELVSSLTNSVDCLIMINPICLKYHSSLMTFLTVPGPSRAGYKPDLYSWLSDKGKIFLSFSDYHMYYNRLKLSKEEFIIKEIEQLVELGLTCIFKEIETSTSDLINGNIKLIFERQQ